MIRIVNRVSQFREQKKTRMNYLNGKVDSIQVDENKIKKNQKENKTNKIIKKKSQKKKV